MTLGDDVIRSSGANLAESCITERIDVLVARRLSTFDLVPIVVPHDVDLDRVGGVTAAVGDGPHSEFAAEVTDRIAQRLGVSGEMVSAFRTERERRGVSSRLEHLSGRFPRLARRAVEVPTAAALTATLPPSSLLVLGAPGGSWLQRQLLGPGHRLTVAAPAGAIVVRNAPRRCFHRAVPGHRMAVGPYLTVAEARRLLAGQRSMPVAEAGILLGILRHTHLADAPGDVPVSEIMEPPVSVAATESLEAIADIREHLDDGPVPVTGPNGTLIGTIPPTVSGNRTTGDTGGG